MSDIESIGNVVAASAERLRMMHGVIGELSARAHTSQSLLATMLEGNTDGTQQEVVGNMEEALKVLREAYGFAALAAERLDAYASDALQTSNTGGVAHARTPRLRPAGDADNSTPQPDVLTGQILPPKQGLEPDEYEPGENRKIRGVLGTETSYREAHTRLACLLSEEDSAPPLGDIRGTFATASILSGGSSKARAAFGSLVQGRKYRNYNHGDEYVGVSYKAHQLAGESGDPPPDLLVMATDVLTHNATSVFPKDEGGKGSRQAAWNDKNIERTTDALRQQVETHYKCTADTAETIGFLAECRIREVIVNYASPEIIAAQDRRIAIAWSKIPRDRLTGRVVRIYYDVLGLSRS